MVITTSISSVALQCGSPWKLILIFFLDFRFTICEYSYHEPVTAVLARINVSYTEAGANPKSGYLYGEFGRFSGGAIGSAKGYLVSGEYSNITRVRNENRQGCSLDVIKPPRNTPWVALFLAGGCTDARKVNNAYKLNASAVLLYDYETDRLIQDETFKDGVVVATILTKHGFIMSQMIERNFIVEVEINKGQVVKIKVPFYIKRTSLLFVSISFVVLMFLSLAWLAIYYLQRLRDLNSKGKMARNLNKAVRKALSKMPSKMLKTGDKELSELDCCPICIESYKVSESLRTLPCRHHFHKKCLDPWLLENRTCPMCKMDILNYYGFSVNINEDSTSNEDRNGQVTSSGIPSNSRTNPSASQPNVLPQIAVISQSELSLSSMLARRTSLLNNTSSIPNLLNPRQLTGSRSSLSECSLSSQLSNLACEQSTLVPQENGDLRDRQHEGDAEITTQTSNKNSNNDDQNKEGENFVDSSRNGTFCEPTHSGTFSSSKENSALSANKEPSDAPQSPHNSMSPNTKKNIKVPSCEIENLIKEIQELEQDSPDQLETLECEPTTPHLPQGAFSSVNSANAKVPVANSHSQSLELPTVDCHPNPLLRLVGLTPAATANARTSAAPVEDERPPSNQERAADAGGQGLSRQEDSMGPNRRPSSHVVTVTHS